MMMKRENRTYQYDIAAIIVSYLRNEINEADQRKLDAWVASSVRHKELFSRICDETMQLEEIRKILSHDANSAWVVLKIKAERRRKQRLFRIYKVAASVVVLFGVSMILWLKSSNKLAEEEKLAVREEIVPGRPMARLTVASGITYQLDTLGDLMLASSAAENNGREVVFKDLDEVQQDSLPQYGKMEIPCGGEYRMVLSDGTKVYLNSATVLRFPESFAGCKNGWCIFRERPFSRWLRMPIGLLSLCVQLTMSGFWEPLSMFPLTRTMKIRGQRWLLGKSK